MIKNLPQIRLQQIVDFVVENYDIAPEYLYPKTVEEFIQKDGNSEVFMIEDEYGIEAMCLVCFESPHVAEIYRTVVRLDVREQGLSKKLDEIVENALRNAGLKKVQTYVYANNLPSVFRRLKRGFLVEGLLRNQDGNGRNTYILGKEL